MAINPSMFGIGGAPAAPGLGMPGMGMPPGLESGGGMTPPVYDSALSALSQVMPKSPNPTEGLARVEQALKLCHDLLMAIIPTLMSQNPRLAKSAHAAAEQVIGIRADVRKEAAPEPPPDLMLGMGAAGAPGPMSPPAFMGQGAPGMAG